MNKEELQLILQEGEGYHIEFKEQCSSLAREMVAFSNASGGRIFVGVSDGKQIPGIEITNKLKSQVQDTARNCDPSIEIVIEPFENILIISVLEGKEKPYRCSAGFFIRVGPNSQKLTRDQILDFIQHEGLIRWDEQEYRDFSTEKVFSEKLFKTYLKRAGISSSLPTVDILANLHAASVSGKEFTLTNTGFLFFGELPELASTHTGITCALYKGTDKVHVLDRKDFDEDIISNIDNAILFLKRQINLRYEIGPDSLARKEIPEIPYDALREAVINAAEHRDYTEKGARVMVEVFDDRVEISNPGALPHSLKEKDFGKRSVLRNPNIAGMLHRIHYIEKLGTGIRKIRNHGLVR